MEFGKEKDLKHFAVHRIASNLGVISASPLTFYYVLSGCDTTLSIFGKSKKIFYNALKVFPEIAKAFVKVASAL